MSRTPELLVVDDNPVVMLALCELLRSAGYTVLEARTGVEAVALARQHHPDLMLLDVVLPDTSGIELCRQIKADPELPSVFVVLLSSIQTGSGNQVSGLEAGADGYIVRPVENRELLARVQSLLRIQQAELALRRAHDELERHVEERTTELARANAGLRAMSLRLVEVQESERRFLARELHDEIGQVLTGLKMTLDQALPMVAPPLVERLNQAVELVNHLVGQTRHLSLQLRPPMLDDLGLLIALDWHFQQYSRHTNILVDFRHTPVPERPAAILEIALFRVVQEALTNVARHAQVSTVAVRLWLDRERLGAQVEDTGIGFDPEAALSARTSSGLTGMKERVELLNGEFSLESKVGKGTRVTVELPLSPVPSTNHQGGWR